MAATETQRPSIKDLAKKVLERNYERNKDATDLKTPATSGATEVDAQRAELRRLVPLFTAHCGFSNEDAEEALQVALEHPDNALMFYRGKVRQLNLQ